MYADSLYLLRFASPRTSVAALVQILNLGVLAFELPVLPSMRGKATSVQGTGWIWARVGAYFVIGFIACKFRAPLARAVTGAYLTAPLLLFASRSARLPPHPHPHPIARSPLCIRIRPDPTGFFTPLDAVSLPSHPQSSHTRRSTAGCT